MHIQKLQIENLRSFKAVGLDFNVPATSNLQIQYPNVNVLLGDNGLGKTSVLRAVALSVLGPLLSGGSGFVSEGLVRRTDAAEKKRLPPPLLQRSFRLTKKKIRSRQTTRCPINFR